MAVVGDERPIMLGLVELGAEQPQLSGPKMLMKKEPEKMIWTDGSMVTEAAEPNVT